MIYDKIAQEEQDKQFQKIQAIWIKEENERIELLKKVYKNREEAIKLKSKENNLITLLIFRGNFRTRKNCIR